MKLKSGVFPVVISAIIVAAVVLTSCSLFKNKTVTLTGTGGALSASGPDDFIVLTSTIGKVVSVQEIRIVFDAVSNHGPAQDVAIQLISPGGKNVTAFANNDSDAGSAEFVSGETYTFVDNGDEDGLDRIVTYSGVIVPETYRADGDFDSFEDWDLKGQWTLRFTAYNPPLSSVGTLLNWRVIIEYDEVD